MRTTTITLSTKGQFSLPKELRESDHVEASDVFRLERLAPGKYVIEKLSPPSPPKAKLVRSKDGFLVFHAGKHAARITSSQIKKLESETI